MNISMINKANESEALPSPSNDKNPSDKTKTMFDISAENELAKLMEKKKKAKEEGGDPEAYNDPILEKITINIFLIQIIIY